MGKAIMIGLAVMAGLLILFVGLIWINSPGKPKQFMDEAGKRIEGRISEKVFISVNGTTQGMFIKGKDVNNPILLFLHGGMPEYFLTEKHPTGMEDYFTVAWWDQRGAGISYDPASLNNGITLGDLVSDAVVVTEYLRKRFNRDKIYLMGHSGGSFVGIKTAALHPELYHAYIGIAQMSYQRKSENLAYEYMLKMYMEENNQGMAKRLERSGLTATGDMPEAYRKIRDTAMHQLGIGTMHGMKNVITGIFIPSLLFKEYTLKEKLNLWRGKATTGISVLWKEMVSTDLSEDTLKFSIPIHFLHGVFDYTCSYTLAKEYFDKIEAPVKEFHSFEQSAHSPIFEEPSKLKEVMGGILQAGLMTLAPGK